MLSFMKSSRIHLKLRSDYAFLPRLPQRTSRQIKQVQESKTMNVLIKKIKRPQNLCSHHTERLLWAHRTCVQVFVETFLQGRYEQRWQSGLILERSLCHRFYHLIVHYYDTFNTQKKQVISLSSVSNTLSFRKYS